ncbi:MAG: prepilin peptidase, partial [Actinobacteria bacterium]|nr:prepilin peptidase [Actinomycetota bacterium]
MLYQSVVITAYVLFVTVILGLCMGSFLNCAAWRIAHGESIAKGRSHCTSCNHVLGAKDLVPVFSWALQRGKCRYCREKISVRYLLVELLTAAIFISVVLKYGLSLTTVEMLMFVSVLICLSLTDLDDYLIPNRLVLAGIAINLVFSVVFTFVGGFTWWSLFAGLGQALIGGLSVALPLLFLTLIADKVMGKETMGGGDIKLFFMVGMYFSWQQNIFLLIVACVVGIVFAVISMKGKVDSDKLL